MEDDWPSRLTGADLAESKDCFAGLGGRGLLTAADNVDVRDSGSGGSGGTGGASSFRRDIACFMSEKRLERDPRRERERGLGVVGVLVFGV